MDYDKGNAKKKWKVIFLLVALQLLGIARNYFSQYNNYFWFCDFVPTLLALSFIINNDQLAKGVINIGLLAQIGYLLAFIYRLVSGVALIALPLHLTPFYVLSSLALHTSTLVAFAVTYKKKPNLSTLSYSFLCLVGIFTITLLFTNPLAGINYVFEPGKLTLLASPYYTPLWITLMFVVIVLPTQLIQYLFYRSVQTKTASRDNRRKEKYHHRQQSTR